jgi:hypothetical protein
MSHSGAGTTAKAVIPSTANGADAVFHLLLGN